MTNEERVFNIFEEKNGIVTTKNIEDEGISRVVLSQMHKKQKIERIKKGIYSKVGLIVDDYYVYQLTHPNVVFSHNTALYIHGMTEKTPDKVDVTVYQGYADSKKPLNFVFHFVPKRILNLGVEMKETPYGNNVKLYNVERTICDTIKFQNKFDPEQWAKTMRNYFFHNKVDYLKLINYSKEMGIYELVRPYLDMSV